MARFPSPLPPPLCALVCACSARVLSCAEVRWLAVPPCWSATPQATTTSHRPSDDATTHRERTSAHHQTQYTQHRRRRGEERHQWASMQGQWIGRVPIFALRKSLLPHALNKIRTSEQYDSTAKIILYRLASKEKWGCLSQQQKLNPKGFEPLQLALSALETDALTTRPQVRKMKAERKIGSYKA